MTQQQAVQAAPTPPAPNALPLNKLLEVVKTQQLPDFLRETKALATPVPPKPIEPGIYFDLPAEDYHSDPALSSTGLKDLLKSPRKYWWTSYMNPYREGLDTDAMKIGRAFHTLILEPEKFNEEFIILPPSNEIKVDSEGWERIQKRYKGFPDLNDFQMPKTARATTISYVGKKLVLREEQFNEQRLMLIMLKSHPLLAKLFEGGRPEVSIFWRDEETGLMCRVRHDYLTPRFSADIKTTTDVSTYRLGYAIADFGYDLSSAYYMEGLNQARKMLREGSGVISGAVDEKWLKELAAGTDENFILVFQDKNAPYATRAKRVPQDVLSLGQSKYREALNIYVRNFERYGTDIWPTGYEGVEELAIEELPQKIYYL